MSIIYVLIVIVIVGLLLWLVNNKIPMDATVKTILNVVVVIILIVWLLKVFGLFAGIAGLKV